MEKFYHFIKKLSTGNTPPKAASATAERAFNRCHINMVSSYLQTYYSKTKPLAEKGVKGELKVTEWKFKTFFGAEWFFLEKMLYFYTLKQFRQKCRY